MLTSENRTNNINLKLELKLRRAQLRRPFHRSFVYVFFINWKFLRIRRILRIHIFMSMCILSRQYMRTITLNEKLSHYVITYTYNVITNTHYVLRIMYHVNFHTLTYLRINGRTQLHSLTWFHVRFSRILRITSYYVLLITCTLNLPHRLTLFGET